MTAAAAHADDSRLEVGEFHDRGFDVEELVQIRFAGRIACLYGVHLLLEVFEVTNDDAESHVFGSKTYRPVPTTPKSSE